MRFVVQRVSEASVALKETGEVVGSIDNGLFVLMGIKKGDTKSEVEKLVSKLVKLRVMADSNDKMNRSIIDTQASVLLVSQFTLYANTQDGNRPSFIEAEEPEKARELYEYAVNMLEAAGVHTQIGSFGNYMEITTTLDGPVTIILEA